MIGRRTRPRVTGDAGALGPEDAQLSTGRVVSLVGCLGLVVAPHAAHVPLWIATLAAFVMLLRAGFAWRGYGLPSKWILALLALAAAAGTWISYGLLFGRDAAVALLILMLCLKLMELKTARDALVVVLLAYFAVITNFLYNQTIAMGAYLVGCVWLITAYLIGMHRHAKPRPIRQILKQSALLLAQATPLMLVFFLFFPRIQGPLWALPQAAGGGVSGLSDEMSPGSLSSLSLSDAVAFRVEFSTPPPAASRLYWRGPVMWDFDGRTWRAGEDRPAFLRDVRGEGPPIRYTVTLEPHNMRWMFAIDIPATRPESGIITSDSQVLAIRPVRSRIRYEMSSYLESRSGVRETSSALLRATQLPDGFNPRTRQLAAAWREQSADPERIVQRALALFREEPFFYTLVPPELGAHSVDEFLFSTRRGFCEHFASSFVVLMRAAGVPARVVTGYQGGVENPMGDYLIVRQADAHAWAEVWLPARGWVRVDPTAAVSPMRIESGVAAALPANDPLPLLMRTDNAWLKRTRFALDAITNGWNQWVLGYTADRQMRIMSQLMGPGISWRSIAVALIGVTLAVVALLAIFTLRRHVHPERDPVLTVWNRLSAKLGKRGLSRLPSEGPVDYIDRVAKALPAQAAQIRTIGRLYTKLRYGLGSDTTTLGDLRRAVRTLRFD